MAKIKRDMLINDVIAEYPEVIEVFMQYGLHCVGCHFSQIDTIESGAKIHGMSEKEIEMMVADANGVLEMED